MSRLRPMSANLLEKVTPAMAVDGTFILDADRRVVAKLFDDKHSPEGMLAANAQLFALAYDHALLLRAGALAVAQVASFEVGVAVDNEWVRFAVRLDAFGIPALTPELRIALEAVVRSANG